MGWFGRIYFAWLGVRGLCSGLKSGLEVGYLYLRREWSLLFRVSSRLSLLPDWDAEGASFLGLLLTTTTPCFPLYNDRHPPLPPSQHPIPRQTTR